MSQKPLGRWATEAKAHLQKFRPKMARQLAREGKLDDWAVNAARRAADQYGAFVESGMDPLEAQSEAKRNWMFLPTPGDVALLGENQDPLPDPASLVTTPGANHRKRPPKGRVPGSHPS